MVSLRKFNCYRNWDRAYTRKSKFKKKAFIKAVPPHKIVRFHLGNKEKDDWKYKILLKTNEKMQIRHNAIEASRQVVNRQLVKNIGSQNYHFVINIFPHQVLRENKQLTGAGSDRMQTGMKHSFGKAIGSAARLRKGDTIFTTFVSTPGAVKLAQIAMKKAAPRLPCKILIEKENLE